MKWGCHIDYTTNKALRVLGLINKHVLYDAPAKVRLFAYDVTLLCRPLLKKYACEIWSPITTQFLITKLEEDVQSHTLH